MWGWCFMLLGFFWVSMWLSGFAGGTGNGVWYKAGVPHLCRPDANSIAGVLAPIEASRLWWIGQGKSIAFFSFALKRQVYAVRRHHGSLCNQKQPFCLDTRPMRWSAMVIHDHFWIADWYLGSSTTDNWCQSSRACTECRYWKRVAEVLQQL